MLQVVLRILQTLFWINLLVEDVIEQRNTKSKRPTSVGLLYIDIKKLKREYKICIMH